MAGAFAAAPVAHIREEFETEAGRGMARHGNDPGGHPAILPRRSRAIANDVARDAGADDAITPGNEGADGSKATGSKAKGSMPHALAQVGGGVRRVEPRPAPTSRFAPNTTRLAHSTTRRARYKMLRVETPDPGSLCRCPDFSSPALYRHRKSPARHSAAGATYWLPCEQIEAGACETALSVRLPDTSLAERLPGPPALSIRENMGMMTDKKVVAALRRDVEFVGNAVIAVVFVGFASLALGTTVVDLMAMAH